ncbi:MAG TPA: hypothetical protein VFX45_09020 [Solirubrobacterales bacterium]|nr:hypothetical protein [Solirubrobacterales bacterium]
MLLGLWFAAALACLLGAIAPPAFGAHEGLGAELLDLLRIAITAALAVTMLLGPGVLWRAGGGRRFGLGFMPLPGLAVLVAIGVAAWILGGSTDPQLVCFIGIAPVLGLILGGLLAAGPEDLFEPEEQRALGLVALALGVGIARSIWSLGPVGELYGGTISRNLIVEPRPDSRTSYLIAELIATHKGPYATDIFAPYNFSARGPLPGIASTPLMLVTGGKPLYGAPEYPFQPFDGQGFMAYRIAMMTFTCTAFLAVWELVRRLGGLAAARFALLLAITTPFLIADLWFTWPKLLAAAFTVLAAVLVFERRAFRGGLLVGVGYLMHPSALLGLFALGPLTVWPPRGGSWKRPQVLRALLLLAGVAVGLYLWRRYNGDNFNQEGFLDYVGHAVPDYTPSFGTWIEFRANSLANTVVPLYLPIIEDHNVSINTLFGVSPGVTHFFFQYWTGVPFGFAIVFFPLLLASLWRAGRQWPWPVLAAVVFPFLAFTVYWGASSSGMLREGLQFWVLSVLAVVALQQAQAGFPWLRSTPIRVLLSLRALEVLAMTVGAVLGTRHFDPIGAFPLVDVVALGAIVALTAAMARAVWASDRPAPAAPPSLAGTTAAEPHPAGSAAA